ncbi:transcription termination/antitermination protein NusA [Biomaibacter acetigenes]|uniref:Transcription termination/antitermination protein NusA n=2 Tax=Biomaibacter acetigenes TaxID=2316383 RepID=A0A3G2R5X3_9FIRM|nr:transcription termination factor NusA [Biomaibacter acetigenes]AYO30508.1 transcription termination/antitermination protein NusA [Biomaibacter acetigenes]
MNIEFIEAIEQLEKEKGISKELLLEALEASLISAYKKNYGSAQNVAVNIDRDTGEVKVFSKKTVTNDVKDPLLEIDIEEASTLYPTAKIGDVISVEVTPRKFGRIAAQTAKQVVMQRIREAERNIIYEEFSGRETDIVTGVVQRFDKKNIIIDLGKIEVVLPPNEQIPTENYNQGDRIKVYILEVKKTTKGPQITVSRSHPGLVKRLFELEVPEIFEGVVEIKGIAREAGSRTKIAVYSKNENVDPVGSCVGPKGTRVQAVVEELKGEKIDIIKWDKNISTFISNSLSPARVLEVAIEENNKIARVTVAENQLSLAIGKEGQNARLAAKLTGWKIDIKVRIQEGMKVPKKIPQRMCLGCRQMKPKKELTRIVRTVDGKIEVDPTGKKSGRGAYVCKDPKCLEIALKEERLSKALDTSVSKETINRLKEDLSKI